jgi:SAM-dependent methyltransferase
MAGFSADWLSLREPADHRARDAALRHAALGRLSGLPQVTVTDLGCGSGSNLRALAPHLGAEQHWRLVDLDPTLLEAAASALLAWADEGRVRPDGTLDLRTGGKQLSVSFLQADLAANVEAVLDLPADLVTAAAFFDLVSADWIERFARAAVVRALPLYTVLTYDGRETWAPPHPADAAVLAAFHAHQASDKGFGPAAGPRASGALQNAFEAQGWRVDQAPSPWRLGPSDTALIQALAEGAAQAASETGRLSEASLADWRASRRAATGCEIGHLDLFARP